jgi:hypothetical protein
MTIRLSIDNLVPRIVTSSEPGRELYFEPDLSSAKKSSADFLTERARTLKRLMVHRSPLMPAGQGPATVASSQVSYGDTRF